MRGCIVMNSDMILNVVCNIQDMSCALFQYKIDCIVKIITVIK